MKKRDGEDERDYHVETRLIHGKFFSEEWNYEDHIVPPISSSVAYRLESAARGAAGFERFANPDLADRGSPIYVYDRLEEPTRGLLEERLRMAEGGECAVTFATGMAAVSAALGVLVRTGDTVLCHRTIYGCTYSLLTNWYPRLGIQVRFLDLRDAAALRKALDRDAMVLYLETPTNPTLDILDLEAIAREVAAVNARRGKRRRVFTVVDNTFATPFCQRPLRHGIDLVVHSLTKNVGGFGTDMGGVVVGPRLLKPDLLLYRKDFGGALAPKSAWPALVYGLPTLPIRMRRQQETAGAIARFLAERPEIARVAYPGLPGSDGHGIARRQMLDFHGAFAPGSMVYFVFAGPPAEAHDRGRRFIDHLAKKALTVTLAVSLGQVRTLVEHPASMTHAVVPPEEQAKSGIDPGGVRLSVGLEEPADLLADLSSALEAVRR
jgi:cystathionine beta-lyase/cystathionine gamma-synthase